MLPKILRGKDADPEPAAPEPEAAEEVQASETAAPEPENRGPTTIARVMTAHNGHKVNDLIEVPDDQVKALEEAGRISTRKADVAYARSLKKK